VSDRRGVNANTGLADE